MATPDEFPGELKGLIDAVADEEATPEQIARLESILAANPAARRFYRQYMQIHAGLQWRFREETAESEAFEESEHDFKIVEPEPMAGSWSPFRQWLAVAASVVILLGLGSVMVLQPWNTASNGRGTTPADELATLSDAVDCLWGSSRLPTSIGSRLGCGTLQLARGTAEIEFDSGARMILVGPAVLEIQGRDRTFLRSGSATVRVPHQAIGFVVQTPSSRVVDLGTEFGVRADDSGASRVFTFDGKVEVESAQELMEQQSRGNGQRNVQPLLAGQSWEIAANGQNGRLIPQATGEGFTRALPKRDVRTLESLYARTVLVDRPIGYWRFEEEAPGDGLAVADASGYRHDGVFRGNVSSAPGVSGIGGRAVRFDGTSGMVRVPHHPDFSLSSISVEFWIRTDENWNHKYWPGDAVLVGKEVPGISTDWSLIGGSLTEGQNEGRLIVGVGAPPRPDQLLPSSPKLNDGAWHHVVWSRDRCGHNSLYVDGVAAGAMNDGGGSINNPMDIEIGGSLQSAVRAASGNPVDVHGQALKDRSYLSGEMDEVAIYDHALTPERVQVHYRAGKSNP